MSLQKKILLLGGSRYLMPVIDVAHKLGLYVITADFLPDTYAHKYADEYVNVSIVDKEKVLAVAQEKQVAGVMSFACDPGVVSAAYVAEKMGLPFQGSYESTCILQDKGLFRQFLQEHGFNTPHAKSYTNAADALLDVDYFEWPVIVKPVDSAGSKGVQKVLNPRDLSVAIENALKYSINKHFIIEDFITIRGYRSSADPFTIDGKLYYNFYSDQKFDTNADNPFIPDKIIYPCTMPQTDQDYLTDELNRLFELLHMGTGIYNIEACVGINGKPYIMEVSPRGGGNSIAEEQRMAYGIDLVENEVRHAVGLPLLEFPQDVSCDGYWCNYAVHAGKGQQGVFKEIVLDERIKERNLKYLGINVQPGDMVMPFTGAGMCLGDMFLRFDTQEEMDNAMANVDKWLKIVLEI